MSELEATRERHVIANHIVTVEVQSLHALLRIEEVLSSILEGMRHFAKQLDKPADTPEVNPRGEIVPPKGRRK
ncbi:hypothetical protein [Bradyrhizobium sp. USDA 4350]